MSVFKKKYAKELKRVLQSKEGREGEISFNDIWKYKIEKK